MSVREVKRLMQVQDGYTSVLCKNIACLRTLLLSCSVKVSAKASRQCCSTGGHLESSLPLETFDGVWKYFRLSLFGIKEAIKPSGQRPRMLLSILQCTGKPTTTKNSLV